MPAKAPSYVRYRKQYARVKIDGKWIHLGRYDSKESHAKYKRLVTQWASDQPTQACQEDDSRTVAEVLEAYRVWALSYYGEDRDGRYKHMLPTIRLVRETFADLPAATFSPKKLKTLRQVFIEQGYSRGHVNACVRRVITIFAWAVEEELVLGSLVHALEAVRPLKRGRTSAPEGKTVQPVSQADIDVTLQHMTPVLADMVQLQLVSGCRPGEVCRMTPGQIDRRGDVWMFRPSKHKGEHHGRDRVVALGPKAQAILRRYLLRADDAPCFSPKESLDQFFDHQQATRKTPLSCGNRPKPGGREDAIAAVGDGYTAASYRRAVERACKRAKVPAWTPHRLRHTRATEVRERYGLDGAQAVLGHSHARVTELYGELNTAKAAEIARQIG